MKSKELPVIDWELGIKVVGNKRELAEEILQCLLKQIPDDLVAIQSAYHAKQYEELFLRVHKLHGALCYSGLTRIKLVVRSLETCIKAKELDDLPTLFTQLEREINLFQLSFGNNLRTCHELTTA